ncbi:hypothetical protein [Mycolicibacterium sp. TY81]|uniref:hypothetical protein n=1 Tax=Mycolicibacterium sp. TY81 TaxID=2759662 RepID=UPI001BB41B0C|nr:hypothetical protein [Mycolicibacterium sp. TY81]
MVRADAVSATRSGNELPDIAAFGISLEQCRLSAADDDTLIQATGRTVDPNSSCIKENKPTVSQSRVAEIYHRTMQLARCCAASDLGTPRSYG